MLIIDPAIIVGVYIVLGAPAFGVKTCDRYSRWDRQKAMHGRQ
jgi:hypothetical protein